MVRWEASDLYVILIMVAVVATLFGVGTLVHRRRHRRIREMIAAMGGEVVAIGYSPFPSAGTLVDYIGPQGELRRAVMLNGQTELREDRPFELVMREKYERDSSEMLSALMLAASYSKLPGYQDYKALILEVTAEPKESVTINEAASDASAERRFAPMVQCFETRQSHNQAIRKVHQRTERRPRAPRPRMARPPNLRR